MKDSRFLEIVRGTSNATQNTLDSMQGGTNMGATRILAVPAHSYLGQETESYVNMAINNDRMNITNLKYKKGGHLYRSTMGEIELTVQGNVEDYINEIKTDNGFFDLNIGFRIDGTEVSDEYGNGNVYHLGIFRLHSFSYHKRNNESKLLMYERGMYILTNTVYEDGIDPVEVEGMLLSEYIGHILRTIHNITGVDLNADVAEAQLNLYDEALEGDKFEFLTKTYGNTGVSCRRVLDDIAELFGYSISTEPTTYTVRYGDTMYEYLGERTHFYYNYEGFSPSNVDDSILTLFEDNGIIYNKGKKVETEIPDEYVITPGVSEEHLEDNERLITIKDNSLASVMKNTIVSTLNTIMNPGYFSSYNSFVFEVNTFIGTGFGRVTSIFTDDKYYRGYISDMEIEIGQDVKSKYVCDYSETFPDKKEYITREEEEAHRLQLDINRQQGLIESLVADNDESNDKISKLSQNVDGFEFLVQSSGDLNLIADPEMVGGPLSAVASDRERGINVDIGNGIKVLNSTSGTDLESFFDKLLPIKNTTTADGRLSVIEFHDAIESELREYINDRSVMIPGGFETTGVFPLLSTDMKETYDILYRNIDHVDGGVDKNIDVYYIDAERMRVNERGNVVDGVGASFKAFAPSSSILVSMTLDTSFKRGLEAIVRKSYEDGITHPLKVKIRTRPFKNLPVDRDYLNMRTSGGKYNKVSLYDKTNSGVGQYRNIEIPVDDLERIINGEELRIKRRVENLHEGDIIIDVISEFDSRLNTSIFRDYRSIDIRSTIVAGDVMASKYKTDVYKPSGVAQYGSIVSIKHDGIRVRHSEDDSHTHLDNKSLRVINKDKEVLNLQEGVSRIDGLEINPMTGIRMGRMIFSKNDVRGRDLFVLYTEIDQYD